MTRHLAAALLAALPLAPAAAQSAPSPIARLVVHPTDRTMTAGDTLRLRVEALDAAGRPVPGATFRFNPAGAYFEATVGEDGLISSGSTGIVPVGVVAMAPGAAPVTERVEIRMVPGPVAVVEISPGVGTLAVGQRWHLSAATFSAMRDRRDAPVSWSSSAPGVLAVDGNGRLTALRPGAATVTAAAAGTSATLDVRVASAPIARVELTPSTTEARQGDAVRFQARALDERGAPIPGLTPAFSLAPGNGVVGPDGVFVGYEPGEYTVTASFGDRSADARVRLARRDVRRPLEVVGRLPRTRFLTEEVWVHPNGRVAYLGTGGGGDRMYAIDISDPANPVVTDSLMADTRRVNDVMTTPDGRFLVHTREGASSRRNGIVIASLEDPLHPKAIAEFTEGVTAGVHSAFVYAQPGHGTHVYLTNNGTSAMHVVDISDPYHPREVGRWRSPSPAAGGSLHDIDVQDGLAYLSNWNDGLIVLDVGNGMRGGSPSEPKFVTQYKYDLNDLYRNVEVDGGPGFIRGTHTAWRKGDYVFIADEVFPSSAPEGTTDAAASRAYGRMQVIDVSDLENPRSVAWYEPEDGGVHNLWIDGDRLYMGAYDAGFRIWDISGELRGDLRAQGREIAHLNTADMDGLVPNTAMTWGVVVKNGLAYVNDNHNGLWIVRVDEPRASTDTSAQR